MLSDSEIYLYEGVDELRIAICDDEKSEIMKIQNTIAELQGNYQVDTYQVSVNMRFISQMTSQKCIMKDGCTFLLSRNTAKENRERYYRFIEQNL